MRATTDWHTVSANSTRQLCTYDIRIPGRQAVTSLDIIVNPLVTTLHTVCHLVCLHRHSHSLHSPPHSLTHSRVDTNNWQFYFQQFATSPAADSRHVNTWAAVPINVTTATTTDSRVTESNWTVQTDRQTDTRHSRHPRVHSIGRGSSVLGTSDPSAWHIAPDYDPRHSTPLHTQTFITSCNSHNH